MLQMEISKDEAFDKILNAAKQMSGWTITYESKEEGRIEGISTTCKMLALGVAGDVCISVSHDSTQEQCLSLISVDHADVFEFNG